MAADYTLSDMPDTLCRVDTAGTADGSASSLFGGVGGVTPRSGGSVYVKGPMGTFSFFDIGSGTFKTIEIPSILPQYGEGDPPDLCRIVTLPVLGPRAIIWHAGTIGIYAAGPPGWATPNAARRIPLIRPISDSYISSGALFVPNAGAGAGDCNINPFPIVRFIGSGSGIDSGFANWANMPWFGATWMFPDPTGGEVGALPYPYSISPWVEAGYGDAYQGSVPAAMMSFSQPTCDLPTIDVQDYAPAIPFGFHIPSLTITIAGTPGTGGLILTDDPAFVGTPDPFQNIDFHLRVYKPGERDPTASDDFGLSGLTGGPDIVRQYLLTSGTYLVRAYYSFSYGSVVMFYGQGQVTSVVIP